MKKWHIADINQLERELATDVTDGLTIREARARLQKEIKRENGKRRYLFAPQKSSFLTSALAFLLTPSLLLTLVVSLLACIFGYVIQGAWVLALALTGAALGGAISVISSRNADAMKDCSSPLVRVRRGGNRFYTDGRNVVVGDVISVRAGDLLPCDARIVSECNLVVKELISTADGIRNRTLKKTADVKYTEADGTVAPNALNMLYAGSAILEGEAIAVAVATGADVYLCQYLEDGELGGKDVEMGGVTSLRSTMQKICFLCAAGTLLLSIISLVTLQKEPFVSSFLMILSSVALISTELLERGAKYLITKHIKKIAFGGTSDTKKKDASAQIKSIRAFDVLSGVDDLVIVDDAGICDGAYHVSGAYVNGRSLDGLCADTEDGNRLLNYIHTYVKAQRESGIENEFVRDGVAESLGAHLRACGFDVSGASLVLKSLYYASEPGGDSGYACAETSDEQYRVALTFDGEKLKYCQLIRKDGELCEISENDEQRIADYCRNARFIGSKCLYVISGDASRTVFEGVVALDHRAPSELSVALPELEKMGVKTTVLLYDEQGDGKSRLTDPSLAQFFNGEVAYASRFRSSGEKITDNVGKYCAYVGFSSEEYATLITELRTHGRTVAAYGIDNGNNDVMACADIVISCDVIKYSSDKYKASVYERLVPDGRDTSIRCSQQTRLLSGVLVRRTHLRGGGLVSIAGAVRAARSAYISLTQTAVLIAVLMSSLISTVAVSVLTGNVLLDVTQVISLSVVGAFMSVLIFTDTEPRAELLNVKRDYTSYARDTLRGLAPEIIARAILCAACGIAVKILDVTGAFGEFASYKMAVFISLLLTMFVDIYLINRDYTKKGEGRNKCWLKVIVAYAVLIGACAVQTQGEIAKAIFPNGIGTYEFLIVPVYVVLYIAVISVTRAVYGRRNKR